MDFAETTIKNFSGLSSETKPTLIAGNDVPNGSRWREVDTDKTYHFNFNDDTWYLSDTRVIITTASSVTSGLAEVVTSGTPVQLPTAACKKVKIWSLDSNNGTIFIGDSLIDQSTGQGFALFQTQAEEFSISNLNLLYIDSTVSGDKVGYVYFN